VLFPVRDLVRRWRVPPSRTSEIREVRQRIARAGDLEESVEVVALAGELRALRPQVLAAFDAVRSCSGCGRGRSEPHGHWNGGFCCGGKASGVFDDDEVAALALAGTKPRDLHGPAGDHAGCAFRGPHGCSLDARDRPNVCVRFVCRELEAELRADGRWDRVRALTRQLDETFRRFVQARRAQAATTSDEPLP
jgi:hypothetical protein